MNHQEKIDWLRLSRTETVGPITFHRLLNKYKTPAAALDILPVLTKNKPIRICDVGTAEREFDALTKHGGQMIFAGDENYPLALTSMEDAPPVLSVLGNIAMLNKQSVALVGSRNASLNARKLAHKMAADLGKADITIVSGLARGIDTSAHEGSLATGTIAVVAGGVDVIYPKENTDLFHKIVESGAVISECAWGMQPLAQHFPKRNRIVSGLSVGTVVIEASLRSGSLITARMAGEQGRDVMAVPGFPLDPRSEGTNALLRDGVLLVRDAADVLEQINSFLGATRQSSQRSEQISFSEIVGMNDGRLSESPANDCFSSENLYSIIFPELSSTPVEVDEIVRVCNLRSADVQGTLLEMELEGVVQRLPGNRVCLVNG